MSDEVPNGEDLPEEVSERPRLRAYGDGYHMQMNPDLFGQSLELSRLAIDLARLAWQREKKKDREPIEFLGDAVNLVNEAARFAAYHPKVEEQEALKRVDDRLESGRVKFEVLFIRKPIEAAGGGRWTPAFNENADPKGLEDALRKHFLRMVGRGMKEGVLVDGRARRCTRRARLVHELMLGRGDVAGAIRFLEGGYYAGRAGVLKKAAESVGRGVGFQWARRVFHKWSELVADKALVEKGADWMKNGIPPLDLAAFAETQQRRNKAKGKGRTKAKKTERGKDHPQAKKKHAGVRKSAERSKARRESS